MDLFFRTRRRAVVVEQMAAFHLADAAAAAYGQSGSWEAVARALDGWPVGPVGRIVVVDRSGTVVVDTIGQWRGRSARGWRRTAARELLPQASMLADRCHIFLRATLSPSPWRTISPVDCFDSHALADEEGWAGCLAK